MTDMASTQILFRDAQAADAHAIAELYRMAAGGVADVAWDKLRDKDEDILDTGARRFAREGTGFSYQNCALGESRGRIVALMHAYPMQVDADFDPETVDPVLRPYTELEEAGSYYISGVAVRADLRGRGIGTKLLRMAELRAMTRGLNAVSLIAFAENKGSVRLYDRLGYKVVDSRAIVPHPAIPYGGSALLMVKELR